MFKSLLILLIGDFDISILNMLSNNRIFEQEMVRQNPRVRVEDVWAKFEAQFPMWFKNYVSNMKFIEISNVSRLKCLSN